MARRGRDPDYTYNVEKLVNRLIAECEWIQTADITAESFRSWREKQTKAAKTLNEYLNAVSAMLNWMVDDDRLLYNPLQRVKRIEINGKTRRKRRAYTDDEVKSVLNAARRWRPVYLCAVLTGLRRGELAQLIWGHVFLDSPQPFILIPADVSKNRTEDVVWLHPEVVAVLRSIRTKDAALNDLVFPKMPRMQDHHREILKKAGIAYKDAMGRQADFHALRHTFNTNLARTGVPERLRMAAMRHKSVRLTSLTYTDQSQLPTAAAIRTLPGFPDSGSTDASAASPNETAITLTADAPAHK